MVDSSFVMQADGSLIETAESRMGGVTMESTPLASVDLVCQSWVFRWMKYLQGLLRQLFGMASVAVMLAVTASIPLVQFLSFGYLLEVTGRLARGGRFRDALIGIDKAAVVGSILLGSWLCLLPLRLVSNFWFEAFLIDPASGPTRALRFGQLLLMSLTLLHIASALICGGKLRYFFWPLIAPVSFLLWAIRRIASISGLRRILDVVIGWVSPRLVDDICRAEPIGDWFLPAIVWGKLRSGGLYRDLRDRVWDFVANLRLGYYFWLGFKGFVGTLAWLILPTGFLVASTFSEGGAAGVNYLVGVLFAIPIFALLPFIQAHFAVDGKWVRFAQPRQVWRQFGKSPVAHWLALTLVLVLALPLFLLKIEDIPGELLWTLSLVFVLFSLPARVAVGWAYRRGASRETGSRWWIRYPVWMLTVPVSLSFVLIFTLTRYISWNGALSLFENHVFLLPAPFWL